MSRYNMWATSTEEKKSQILGQPPGTEFYLFSTKWTNPMNGKKRKHDEFVKIWWGKNNSGYTYDLNEAGKYTREQLLDLESYYFCDDIFPLPCQLVEAGEFGRVMKSVYH